MIKKLRIKLIIASMISLFIVLMVIMGSISFLNYQKVITKADDILDLLRENDGVFPKEPKPQDKPFDNDFHKKDPQMSPELPYESRYFSVFLNSEGNVVFCNTGKIAAIDTTTAIEYAQTIFKNGQTKGFMNNYRYISYSSDLQTHIIFLDCGRDLNTLHNFIWTGIGVSIIGLLSVLVLLIILSGHIVKPFIKNYEKQKQFITDAGHELKTPLTIIDANAEVLSMDYGENEWISGIKKQTKRLADLTNSMILLSRMEERNDPYEMIEFPLSDVVEEVTETFQVFAQTQNKSLDYNIEPMITMKGDERNIRRLVTILLDNAVKYSLEDEHISLTLKVQKKHIRLSVYNKTEYISKEHLENLFDRFYRTDQSRNSKTGGYGLGLSIASSIVHMHKGKIMATSDDEKSLRITVILPI